MFLRNRLFIAYVPTYTVTFLNYIHVRMTHFNYITVMHIYWQKRRFTM